MHVSCDRVVTLETALRIHRGKAVLICNMCWIVPIGAVEEPLLGRPIQNALGLDTKKFLSAACDRYDSKIDANSFLFDEQPFCFVPRILSSGLFHSDRWTMEDSEDRTVEKRRELDNDMTA